MKSLDVAIEGWHGKYSKFHQRLNERYVAYSYQKQKAEEDEARTPAAAYSGVSEM